MVREKTFSSPTDGELVEYDQMQAIEMAAASGSTELAALEDSPVLNKMLLKNARKSPAEIEKLTGIPASEVAERLMSLLDNRSWRDDLMEEKLLLLDVSMLIDDIRERMSRFGVEDEGWASMARVQLQSIKTILEQMDKRRKAVDGQLALVTMLQAQLMAEAIKLAQERAILNIRLKYPELDTEIIYAEFEEALPLAIEYLEARADG
jgi:hypothetical protein